MNHHEDTQVAADGGELDEAALDVGPPRATAARRAWLPSPLDEPMPTGDEPPALRVRLSGGRDPRFEAALAALRVVVATPDEFDELDKAHLAPARARGTFGDGVARPELLTRAIVGGLASTPRATDRNERAALETLLRLADEAESALVADSGGASTANRRHALYYVDGQRRILRSVGEAARVRLARLNTG